jgi:hypothetical protein
MIRVLPKPLRLSREIGQDTVNIVQNSMGVFAMLLSVAAFDVIGLILNVSGHANAGGMLIGIALGTFFTWLICQSANLRESNGPRRY